MDLQYIRISKVISGKTTLLLGIIHLTHRKQNNLVCKPIYSVRDMPGELSQVFKFVHLSESESEYLTGDTSTDIHSPRSTSEMTSPQISSMM